MSGPDADSRRWIGWILWILIYSILWGGHYWHFPNEGRGLLEMKRLPELALPPSE